MTHPSHQEKLPFGMTPSLEKLAILKSPEDIIKAELNSKPTEKQEPGNMTNNGLQKISLFAINIYAKVIITLNLSHTDQTILNWWSRI